MNTNRQNNNRRRGRNNNRQQNNNRNGFDYQNQIDNRARGNAAPDLLSRERLPGQMFPKQKKFHLSGVL